MEHGAESERVHTAIRKVGERFVANRPTVLVSYDALLFSLGEGGANVLRRARPRAVDMSPIDALSHLTHRIDEGALGPAEVGAAVTGKEWRTR